MGERHQKKNEGISFEIYGKYHWKFKKNLIYFFYFLFFIISNILFNYYIIDLAKDLQNSPLHVLGIHKKCNDYFVVVKKISKINWVPQAIQNDMLMEINKATNQLVYNSKSLIVDVDNNICEQFNNIINKFIGGKRINLSQRNVYNTRVEATVISFNTNEYLRDITKNIMHKSSGIISIIANWFLIFNFK